MLLLLDSDVWRVQYYSFLLFEKSEFKNTTSDNHCILKWPLKKRIQVYRIKADRQTRTGK